MGSFTLILVDSCLTVLYCPPGSWRWTSLRRLVGRGCVATPSWSLRSTWWMQRVCRDRIPTEVCVVIVHPEPKLISSGSQSTSACPWLCWLALKGQSYHSLRFTLLSSPLTVQYCSNLKIRLSKRLVTFLPRLDSLLVPTLSIRWW